MTLLHKLNIRISGIFYLYGDIIPFFRHNHFLNLVKAQAPLNGYGNTLILFSLCSNNRSLRFSVRQLRLAHFLILKEKSKWTSRLENQAEYISPKKTAKGLACFRAWKSVLIFTTEILSLAQCTPVLNAESRLRPTEYLRVPAQAVSSPRAR